MFLRRALILATGGILAMVSMAPAMAESSDGTIYVTASRLHEMAWFRSGAAPVVPTTLFRLLRA